MKTCFVNYRRSVGPPEEVRDLLEEYLDRVLDVRQEVARATADAPADGAVVAVESAQRWYEAAVLSARIAMATVQCLYDLEPAQYLRAVAWCTYQRDLYAAGGPRPEPAASGVREGPTPLSSGAPAPVRASDPVIGPLTLGAS